VDKTAETQEKKKIVKKKKLLYNIELALIFVEIFF